MQATTKLDKPGYTRVEVRSVVRADDGPRYHVTGNCRPKTENMCHCGRCCWDVDKIFPTDPRDNNKDEKKRGPSPIFVPTEGQKRDVIDGEVTMLTS